MKKLRGAVVGVGYLGRFHAQKIQASSSADLVGVYDFHKPQAEKTAAELSVKAFQDLDEVTKNVDFVTIAAATQAHYDLALHFLKNKIPTLVEKPIAATSAQGFELSNLAVKNNVIFSVGHIERFNPSYQIILDSADQTTYFEINRLAPFRMRGADVSVLHDLMIHDLDLINFIFKSDVVDFEAQGSQFIQPTIDDVSVRLKLKSGLQVTINNSRVHPVISRNYRAIQKNRSIYLNTATLEGEILTRLKEDPYHVVTPFKVEKVDALQLEINHFIDVVSGQKSVAITGEEASAALKMIETIIERIMHQKKIY